MVMMIKMILMMVMIACRKASSLPFSYFQLVCAQKLQNLNLKREKKIHNSVCINATCKCEKFKHGLTFQ